MTAPILTLAVQSPRDVLLARQRARQLAGLLRFPILDQAWLAAAVFEVARGAWRGGLGVLNFELTEGVLRVSCSGPGRRGKGVRLERRIPKDSGILSAEDLDWAVHHLTDLTPLNVFQETHQQNQELLRALQELRASRAELSRLSGALDAAA